MGRKSSKKHHKILPKKERYCQFIVELNNKSGKRCSCQGNVNNVRNCPFIDSLKRPNFPGNDHVALDFL